MGLRTINPTRVQAKRLKRIIEAPTDEAANEHRRCEFMRQDADADARRRACTSSSSAAARSASTSRRSSSRPTTKCSSSSRTPNARRRSPTSSATSSWKATAARPPCSRRRARRAPTCCSPSPATTRTTSSSCQVAKQRFNVARTVARINDPKNEEIFRKLEVDITVSATSAIMAHIEQELPTHHLIPLDAAQGQRPRDRRGAHPGGLARRRPARAQRSCCRTSR